LLLDAQSTTSATGAAGTNNAFEGACYAACMAVVTGVCHVARYTSAPTQHAHKCSQTCARIQRPRAQLMF
jgi:hypothetical protein